MKKVSVDFGTTNTVVAVWREALNAPETLYLPGLSIPAHNDIPPLIPSLVYVEQEQTGSITAGHAVRMGGLDMQDDERFFSSFKRGIAAAVRPIARTVDGVRWDERKVGNVFLSRVLAAVADHEGGEIDELIFSVPVESFEYYLKWLGEGLGKQGNYGGWQVRQVRVVDESTAAALGYGVHAPGDLVMVFDFGGGTLDVSLVRMPYTEEGRGIVLEVDKPSNGDDRETYVGQAQVRVVAKAGRILGGDDIDHWLLDEMLERNQVERSAVGDSYTRLKTSVEAAKIRLSEHETAEISVFDPDSQRTYRATLTRTQLEDVLDQHHFYEDIKKTVNKVLSTARGKGVSVDEISTVLMVGGSSLIPSVRRLLRTEFGGDRVREHKPFEAVAHGALHLAVGTGIDDFLYHSYGVRHLSPISGRHEWEEIIPAGARYPTKEPITLILTASRDGQEALELVIGEVEESAGGITEVMFGDRAILMVEGGMELRRVVALNDLDGARTVAHLDPPGKAGEDRVEVIFSVDQNRSLRVTIMDLLTHKELLRNMPVVELR